MENKLEFGRNWIVRYFRGGYLAESCFMTKEQARNFMTQHIDGYYMQKVKGINKGEKIYKHPENEEKI